MDAFYNKLGKVVAWLEDKYIYDIAGNYQAFIKEEKVFNKDGEYIGTLNNGYFRDKEGYIVAFNSDVTENLDLPPLQVIPEPGLADVPFIPEVMYSSENTIREFNQWSDLNWEEFIENDYQLVS
ncbi:PRC-barrel domain protein [Orenia metallireducens]|jgi:hypothetical protein|uniref:PRC-barrel domain-containing protein n=1 Tax=Orenia metallireducens TaxID=1413210 RepID=A0A285GI88_9FIRM|nr:PRC-barrel domain-containing protein [Orenia metallireducens]PRX30388.1 PRC-barrel domain protein [Orenia metallireducens]SNY22226.1 PRC-barrel domain-containing protein [Orenia metallireducens]